MTPRRLRPTAVAAAALAMAAIAMPPGAGAQQAPPTYRLLAYAPDGTVTELATLPALTSDTTWSVSAQSERGVAYGLSISYAPGEGESAGRGLLEATLTSATPTRAFLALRGDYAPGTARAYNFDGPVDSAEVYRQSPHDVDAWIVETIPMQAVPVAAFRTAGGFRGVVGDAPFHYDNYTSQRFAPREGWFEVRTGDDGRSPGMQPDTSRELALDYNGEKSQRFTPGRVEAHYARVGPAADEALVLRAALLETSDTSRNGLRRAVNATVARAFGGDADYDDYFGQLAFATAYMNVRANDMGHSDYWVVPAVAYGNRQYGRDAFWIATMLPDSLAAECLRHELDSVNNFAEYPLFALIWAYRAHRAGADVDLDDVRAYYAAVESRVRDHTFYSYTEDDGRLDFQYWGDLMAFERDDVIAYNQGLFAVALRAAEALGLRLVSDPDSAAARYRALYDEDLGYLPVSRQKPVLTPDALVPDLLAQLYFGEPLLETPQVRRHYDRLVRHARTPYGYKVVATPTGDYLDAAAYDVPGYTSQVNRGGYPDGRYYRGGSYFLYDCLAMMAAHLHGVPRAADDLKWRVGLDFAIGSTTYETLNTITGEPWKPNMGWNVAVYAIWRELVEAGRAPSGLFAHVDEVLARP